MFGGWQFTIFNTWINTKTRVKKFPIPRMSGLWSIDCPKKLFFASLLYHKNKLRYFHWNHCVREIKWWVVDDAILSLFMIKTHTAKMISVIIWVVATSLRFPWYSIHVGTRRRGKQCKLLKWQTTHSTAHSLISYPRGSFWPRIWATRPIEWQAKRTSLRWSIGRRSKEWFGKRPAKIDFKD